MIGLAIGMQWHLGRATYDIIFVYSSKKRRISLFFSTFGCLMCSLCKIRRRHLFKFQLLAINDGLNEFITLKSRWGKLRLLNSPFTVTVSIVPMYACVGVCMRICMYVYCWWYLYPTCMADRMLYPVYSRSPNIIVDCSTRRLVSLLSSSISKSWWYNCRMSE